MRAFVLVLVAFSSSAQGGGDGPSMPALVTPEEVAGVEKRLMDRVENNRERRCPRPVLGGASVPGSGRELVAAVVEGDALASPCAIRAEVLRDLLTREAIAEWRRDPSSIPPAVQQGLHACEAVSARVVEAVTHEDVCSPYRPGVRPAPALLGFVRRSKLAILGVRVRHDPAHPLDTITALLAWAQLTQDLQRGGGTLLPTLVGVASFQGEVVPTLRWALEEGGLDAGVLRRVASDLGDLLDSEPSLGPALTGDPDTMLLQVVLPALKGSGYVPPGGWEDGYGPAPGGASVRPLVGATYLVSPQVEQGLLAVAFDEIGRQEREACPEAGTVLACRTRLSDLAVSRAARVKGLSTWRLGLRILVSGDMVREIREIVIDILASIALPAFHKYIDRIAERAFSLAALRIHALVLAASIADGGCPAPEELTGAAWEPVLRDPVFGGQLGVERIDGGYAITPASWFEARPDGDGEGSWRYEFRCTTPSAG